MAKESHQRKISRTRKPRVHITYDVEIGDAIETRELPFVVGVLADLSGNHPARSLPKLKDRSFVDISRNNFDEVLKKQKPRIAMKVDNKLSDKPDEQLAVDLTFESMKDFDPDRVVERIKPLRDLMDVRNRLKSLLAKSSTSDEVSAFLKDVLLDDAKRAAVAKELGIGSGGSDAAPAPGTPEGGSGS
jgi:type VI secretion system protein ImpB